MPEQQGAAALSSGRERGRVLAEGEGRDAGGDWGYERKKRSAQVVQIRSTP